MPTKKMRDQRKKIHLRQTSQNLTGCNQPCGRTYGPIATLFVDQVTCANCLAALRRAGVIK
jgi:hypothetical protein